MPRRTATEGDDPRFRELPNIGTGEALARLGVIVVGVVLSFVAGARFTVGSDRWPGWVALVLLLVVFAGVAATMFWVVMPWMVSRITRKVWDGSLRIDQGEILRVARLEKRPPWWRRLLGER